MWNETGFKQGFRTTDLLNQLRLLIDSTGGALCNRIGSLRPKQYAAEECRIFSWLLP